MNNEEDFSVENDPETQSWVSSQSSSEYQRTLQKLKRDHRKEKLLYLRSIGRHERLKLKAKYGSKTSPRQ
jgi:hypothetical protein